MAISSNTTTTSDSVELFQYHTKGLIVESVVSSRTDGTYTTTVEHSPDGSTWYTLTDDENAAVTCAAQSANGGVLKVVLENVPMFPYLRASVASTSVTTGATVTVNLHFGDATK